MDKDRDLKRFDVFLASVILHTTMATCNRLRVACGIFKNKRLVGIGYNGSVSGEPHCDDADHWIVDGHCERTRHAEENAISNTDRHNIRGAEAIITATPCIRCMKLLIEEEIKKIYYVGEYQNAKGKELISNLAKNRGVEIIQFEIDYLQLFQRLFDMMKQEGGVLERAGYGIALAKAPFIFTQKGESNE